MNETHLDISGHVSSIHGVHSMLEELVSNPWVCTWLLEIFTERQTKNFVTYGVYDPVSRL